MENLDTNDLIEKYLDGSLPPAERQALETRLATDPTFRADVELHRQLHQEFADPRKLQLRDMLGDIVRESPPPAPYRWLKGMGFALVVLFAGWGIWRWASSARLPVPDHREKTTPAPLPPSAPTTPPANGNLPPGSAGKHSNRPIAMAKDAAFAPNPVFEARLGNIGIRSTSGDAAEMQRPAPGADFTPENGVVKINFEGLAPADADTARYPLALNIYTAVSANTPVVRLEPVIRLTSAGKWAFVSRQRLRLAPGLYYFTVERQATETLIYVGKFTVGAKPSNR